MLKELKETIDKELKEIRKMMYEQKGNKKYIDIKRKKKKNRNSKILKYSNWNEKLSNGVQY